MRALVASAVILALAGAPAAGQTTGDALLAQAAGAPGLASYSVPVHLDVHLHKPIGAHTGVEARADFQGPGQAQLVILKASGLIGMFFHGTYKLDIVPQAWPGRYHVLSVGSASGPSEAPQTVLQAVPDGPSDVAQVTFVLDDATHAPVAATWLYKNKSTIKLTFVNAPVGAYHLPQSATIMVDLPSDKLDAAATYGAYALKPAGEPPAAPSVSP